MRAMRRRDLQRLLLDAARAMPGQERRKFGQLLRGRPSASRPRDGLPPITLDRDPPAEKPRRRWPETPDDFRQLALF